MKKSKSTSTAAPAAETAETPKKTARERWDSGERKCAAVKPQDVAPRFRGRYYVLYLLTALARVMSLLTRANVRKILGPDASEAEVDHLAIAEHARPNPQDAGTQAVEWLVQALREGKGFEAHRAVGAVAEAEEIFDLLPWLKEALTFGQKAAAARDEKKQKSLMTGLKKEEREAAKDALTRLRSLLTKSEFENGLGDDDEDGDDGE